MSNEEKIDSEAYMSDTENPTQDVQQPKKNPYTLWFVVVAFVLPVVAAYTMYFAGYTPTSFTNQGELIQPVIDVDALALVDENDARLSREDATVRKWHMVYFAGRSCDQACNDTLHKIAQVNKAVGKNAYRLRRLIIHLDAPDEAFDALLAQEYPDIRRLFADQGTVQMALQPVAAELDRNDIYLMDPIGNIMMRFTPENSFKDLLHDLHKLFKVSQIG